MLLSCSPQLTDGPQSTQSIKFSQFSGVVRNSQLRNHEITYFLKQTVSCLIHKMSENGKKNVGHDAKVTSKNVFFVNNTKIFSLLS